MLHQLGVDTVEISGISDGTTTSSKSMHDDTLKNVAYGFGKVMYDMCRVSRQNPVI